MSNYCCIFRNSSGSLVLLNGHTFESITNGIYNNHCSKITDLDIARNNQFMVTCGEDSYLQVINIPDMLPRRAISNK